MVKHFITGGACFIGSHLVDRYISVHYLRVALDVRKAKWFTIGSTWGSVFDCCD